MSSCIWADTVCINQSDLEEKNERIWMMRENYASAECVIAWLAEA
jgi:hypothetical protein